MGEWLQVCTESPRHRTRDDGLIEREGTGVVWSPEKRAIVTNVIAQYGSEIVAASQKWGIPPEYFVGLIAMESAGNPNAKSPAGAVGLTQMMPATARGLGYEPSSLSDPAVAIDAAGAYLAGVVKRYGMTELPLLAGAYNAGSRRCSPDTACKTAGKPDGTRAPNSWGLIEDCYKGVGSRYVERVVGASNEAVAQGFGGGGAIAGAAATSFSDAFKAVFPFLCAGAVAGTCVYVITR
mgnify:CR=1 FL=1